MTGLRRTTGQLDPDSALSGFFKDPDWMFKTGLGGTLNAACVVLFVISPFSLPIVLALIGLSCGYLLRVIRFKVLNPDSKLPDWDDWLELFISGLTWLAIQFGLSLIQVSLVTVSFMVANATGLLKMTHPAFLPWAVSTLAVWALATALVSFLNPFLMTNFAIEERVGAGFALAKVLRKVSRAPKTFALAWLLSVGLMWAAVIVPALTVIGVFFIPSTVFVANVLSATLCAHAWGPERS